MSGSRCYLGVCSPNKVQEAKVSPPGPAARARSRTRRVAEVPGPVPDPISNPGAPQKALWGLGPQFGVRTPLMVPYPPWVGATSWYQHPKNPHSGWSQDGTFVGTGPGWGFGDPHPIFAPSQLRFCPHTTTTAPVPGDARVFGDAAKKQATLGRLWGQGSPGGASGCRALVLTP